MLVYPPPGDMALEVVKQYSKFEGNDIVIYVGEGRGGANANQEFFDYFLNESDNGGASIDEVDNKNYNSDGNGASNGTKYKWCVLETIDVEDVLGGGKGFEMMFVLKKVKV